MMNAEHKLIDYKELDYFINDSFDDGRVNCELRLSDNEIEYIQEKYPHSTFVPLSDTKSEKNWYIVCLGLY